MLKVQLVTKSISEIRSEFIVIPIFEGERTKFNGIIENFLQDNPKFGKIFEQQLIYSKERKLFLVGLGKREKFNLRILQNWVGSAVRTLSKKAKEITILIPSNNLSSKDVGIAIAIGSEVAMYDPGEDYKSEYEKNKLNTLEVVVDKADRGYLEGIREGQIIAESVNLARKLSDAPANDMTPTIFLDTVKKLAKENERSSPSGRLKLTVLDEKQAKKKGMGAFVGVAQGSDEPSYMISLEYKGNPRSKDKLGLVGKGITFDSGGISIKPSEAMSGMKYDMVGAATVLAVMIAITKLGIKVNLVSIMAVTENLPSGKALKPDDIVRTYNGKTVEIVSTDAEGRLVLIDAISYAQKDYKATKLIDIATLTGAIIISLGDEITGAFGNSPKFTQQLISMGNHVGEKIWEMPMDEEFDQMLKSDFADITNSGKGGSIGHRTAGSIIGAKFIEAGVDKNIPWIHLDIGGTATDKKSRPYRGVGATGVLINTLVRLIEGQNA